MSVNSSKDAKGIDWQYWQAMRTVKVWQACALAVGLDPDKLKKHPQAWMAGIGAGAPIVIDGRCFPSRSVRERFDKVLRLACSAVCHTNGPIYPQGGPRPNHESKKDVLLLEVIQFLADANVDNLPSELLPPKPGEILSVHSTSLSPLSLAGIAQESARLKAWNPEERKTELGKQICKASEEVFFNECLSRLYVHLENGHFAGFNPFSGIPFLAGTDDPKWPGWHCSAEGRVKALALLGVPAEAGDSKKETKPAQQAPGKLKKTTKGRRWEVAFPYVVGKLNEGQYATAKALYIALETATSDESSPFEKGTALNRGKLFVKANRTTVGLKTIQNAWGDLKAAAKKLG